MFMEDEWQVAKNLMVLVFVEDDGGAAQEKVNDWLSRNPGRVVYDIQFSPPGIMLICKASP